MRFLLYENNLLFVCVIEVNETCYGRDGSVVYLTVKQDRKLRALLSGSGLLFLCHPKLLAPLSPSLYLVVLSTNKMRHLESFWSLFCGFTICVYLVWLHCLWLSSVSKHRCIVMLAGISDNYTYFITFVWRCWYFLIDTTGTISLLRCFFSQ